MDWGEFLGPQSDAEEFKFKEVGDSITGTVCYLKAADTKYGRRPVLQLEGDNGSVAEVWAGSVGLQRALAEANVQVGMKIRIKHTGEQDTGQGNPMKLFTVEVSKKAAPEPPPLPAEDISEEPF